MSRKYEEMNMTNFFIKKKICAEDRPVLFSWYTFFSFPFQVGEPQFSFVGAT